MGLDNEKDVMTSCCLDRKEVRHAIVLGYCPLDRVLTYKNLIYLLNLQFYVEMVCRLSSIKTQFYCVNTSYPMDNMLNRSAQTGPPNVRKRRPVFPPAGRSVVLCTPQMAPRTSFLSRQPDVIASFSFGACTVQTLEICWKRSLVDSILF